MQAILFWLVVMVAGSIAWHCDAPPYSTLTAAEVDDLNEVDLRDDDVARWEDDGGSCV